MSAVAHAAVLPREPHRRVRQVLAVCVSLAALASVPIIIAEDSSAITPYLRIADWLIWTVFVVEYTVMLALAPDRQAYVRGNWLGLAVIAVSFPALPNLLAVARLARLVLLVRLLAVTWRGMNALQAVLGRHGLMQMAAISAILVPTGGVALVLIEPETAKGDYINGIWWAVVTASTVGYGDITPTTVLGRVVAVGLMLTGIGLVSTLAAAIAAHFVGQNDGPSLSDLERRLERIEAAIERLAAERNPLDRRSDS